MKSYSNFTPNTSDSAQRAKLPAGNYKGIILGAKTEKMAWGEELVIQVEITEGEYKGFYKKDFEAQAGSQYGQKYKGVLRLTLPVDDGSEVDGWRMNALERTVGAVVKSNPGYVWDWDERKLKNKLAGIMVRNVTKTFEDGRTGSWTEVGGLCGIDSVETAPILKDKVKGAKAGNAQAPAANQMTEVEDDGELPF